MRCYRGTLGISYGYRIANVALQYAIKQETSLLEYLISAIKKRKLNDRHVISANIHSTVIIQANNSGNDDNVDRGKNVLRTVLSLLKDYSQRLRHWHASVTWGGNDQVLSCAVILLPHLHMGRVMIIIMMTFSGRIHIAILNNTLMINGQYVKILKHR